MYGLIPSPICAAVEYTALLQVNTYCDSRSATRQLLVSEGRPSLASFGLQNRAIMG